ncbi:MAG: oxidoreductase [Paenibacillaceae bacterium]|jgi:predicted dehydrogenase|nr:oxidoreductase [Paenibacillaceae bacterium]
MGKIKIGVIGVGGIAQGVHLPGIEQCGDLVLTAICDIDEEKLQKIGEKYGIEPAFRFTSHHELLACPEVEAVDICTPNDCHFHIAMDAASAGKPYAVEKPITMTAEEADILALHTQKMGVKNMVCFSYRFKTAARCGRDYIQRGLLGEIYHVSMQYLQSWGLPESNRPLAWRFMKERAGSGAFGDLGCHALDLVRFVTGKDYLKIISQADTYTKERPLPDGSGMGTVDVDDYCNYLAQLEDRITASFQITRFGYGRGNYQRMEVFGSKGALIYTLDNNRPNSDELDICIGPAANETKTYHKLDRFPSQYNSDQMQSFADIINGNGDGLAADIEDGRINQHACDAVIQSFEEERWIKLSKL